MNACLLASRISFVKNGHECKTVQEIGLANKKNGELLSLADGKWDVLLTNDRNLKYQQNMAGRKISVLCIASEFKSIV